MDLIFNSISYLLPDYVETYFPYNLIIGFTIFNFILFYQQKWTAEFEGSSEFLHGLLGLFTVVSMILEYAFILIFIISINVFSLQVWAAGVSIIIVAWILCIFISYMLTTVGGIYSCKHNIHSCQPPQTLIDHKHTSMKTTFFS